MNKCIVIYNAKSGKKRTNDITIYTIFEVLKSYNYEPSVIYTKRKGHASKIVKELPNYVCLVVSAGGDGTFNEVVSGNLKRKDKLLIAMMLEICMDIVMI